MSVDIPYLSKEESWEKAEEFRKTIGGAGNSVPIDIFNIIEFDLDIELVPRPGLQSQLGAGAFLTVDGTQIAVDHEQYMSTGAGYRRARFSVAIEIGHLVLHNEVIKSFGISSKRDWEDYATTFLTAKQYDRISMQAIEFAGRLMVPRNALVECVRKRRDLLDAPHANELSNDLLAEGFASLVCDDFLLTKHVLKPRILYERILEEIRLI